MSETEKVKDHTLVVKAIFFALLIGVILAIIWLLTYKQESYVSSEIENGDYGALECTSSDPSEPFFAFETTQEATHEIKILFTDNKLKNATYKYDGIYASREAAENAEAWLHVDYNEYMGDNGINEEILNPNFSVNGNKLIIALYAEAEEINDTVAKLFFMDTDAVNKLENFSVKDFKLLYETKGFTCKTHD